MEPTLDQALRDAEAALPDGWAITELRLEHGAKGRVSAAYRALAGEVSMDGLQTRGMSVSGLGRTFAEALTDLADELREQYPR